MDAQASHGQGSRFLEAFVQHFNIPWHEQDCAGASVTTEVPTERIVAWNRRIDILVWSSVQSKAIAVENKPWATDQQNQVADYLLHIKVSFPGNYRLLYLSSDGSGPSDVSIDADEKAAALSDERLVVVAYKMLVPWLQQCRAVCRADRVSSFLSEFVRFIEKIFEGVSDVNERHEVIRQMTATSEALTAALQIVAAGDDLKQHLLGLPGEQLEGAAITRGWQCTSNLNRRTPSFSFAF